MTEFAVSRRAILAGAAIAGTYATLHSAQARAEEVLTPVAGSANDLPRVKIDLVDPPFVHAHEQVASTGPRVIEFEMTIHEKKIVLDDAGTETWAMTFNGSVPGPLMVVHEGDYVELTLINPDINNELSTTSTSTRRPGRWAAAR
jgi:nitrite reductase (NO-forming)